MPPLSTIARANNPPALTDQLVGISGAVTDNLFTLAQVQSTVAPSITRSQIPTITISVSTLAVSGFSTAGDLGTGAIYTSVGASSGGLMAIQDASGTWFNLVVVGEANAGWFGAKGDGITDDTAALQAAINYVTANSLALVIGRGTYLISSALTFSSTVTAWKILGAARGGSVIEQSTNNTPIFLFSATDIHSWEISDLGLTWSSAQSSSNTLSCGFFFTGSGSEARYNFQIERITFNNGFRSISNNPSISVTTWGCSIRDCVHNATMSGAFFNPAQSTPAGQPNIEIDGLYARMDISQEALIALPQCDSFSLDHIEANVNSNSLQLLSVTGGSGGRVGSIKSEVNTWAGGSSSTNTVLVVDDSDVNIDYLELSSITTTGTGGVYAIQCGGAHANVIVGVVVLSFTSIGGSAPFYLGEPNTTAQLRIGTINGLIGTPGAYLTDVGNTSSAENISVASWEQPRLSADIGDANFSWAIGAVPNVIQSLTTLTADRTITFTDQGGGNDSNLYDGVRVRVVRNAGTPGAHVLNVNNWGGGNLGSLGSGQNGMMEFMWQRVAWRLVNYATWSGTTP